MNVRRGGVDRKSDSTNDGSSSSNSSSGEGEGEGGVVTVAPRNIVEVLQREGLQTKLRIEQSRQAGINKEAAHCSFKPTLYKNPKSVVPKYRGG